MTEHTHRMTKNEKTSGTSSQPKNWTIYTDHKNAKIHIT